MALPLRLKLSFKACSACLLLLIFTGYPAQAQLDLVWEQSDIYGNLERNENPKLLTDDQNRIYILTEAGYFNEMIRVVAYDASGKKLWERPLESTQSGYNFKVLASTIDLNNRVNLLLYTDESVDFVRLDQNGDVLLHKLVTNLNQSRFSAGTFNDDGSVYFAAIRSTSDNAPHRPHIYKVNAEGELQRNWELDLSHHFPNSSIQSIHSLSDGSMYITGSMGKMVKFNRTYDFYPEMAFAMLINKYGDEEWQYNFDYEHLFYSYLNPSEQAVCVTYKRTSSSLNALDFKIHKLSRQGELLNEIHFEMDSGTTFYRSAAIGLNDGSLVLLLKRDSLSFGNWTTIHRSYKMLYFNEKQELSWEREIISPRPSDYFYSSPSGLVVDHFGNCYATVNILPNGFGIIKTFVQSVDRNGKLIGKDTIQHSQFSQTIGYDMATDQMGYLILTGNSWKSGMNNSNTSSIFKLKANTSGNPGPVVAYDVKVYPNPTQNGSYFQLGKKPGVPIDLKVYSAQGKLEIQETCYSSVNYIQTQSLSSGIYFYRLTNGDEVINSGTLVVLKSD